MSDQGEGIITTPRDLLVNILVDVLRASAKIDVGNRITANAYAAGEMSGFIQSAARVVAMLYGGDYEATFALAAKQLEGATLSLTDADLMGDRALSEAESIATELIDTI